MTELMTLPRKPRCLRLVEASNGLKLRGTDQCPNERLPGSDLCAAHLAAAAADFRRVTQDIGAELDADGQ